MFRYNADHELSLIARCSSRSMGGKENVQQALLDLKVRFGELIGESGKNFGEQVRVWYYGRDNTVEEEKSDSSRFSYQGQINLVAIYTDQNVHRGASSTIST